MTRLAATGQFPTCRQGGFRSTAAAAVAAATVTATFLTGCGAGTAGPPTSGGTLVPALTPAQLASGAGHDCLTSEPVRATFDWAHLSNPILSDGRGAVKDEAVIWAGGSWHLLASHVTDDPSLAGGVRWSIASTTSEDLVHWSPLSTWPRQPGVVGVASPDVVRGPAGKFIVTYQSDAGSTVQTDQASVAGGAQDRLFYRTSSDLRTWSAPRPLAASLAPAPGDRMIDGALVFTGDQLLLGFKYSSPTQPQAFEIARSTTGQLQGPWVLVGRPDITVNGDTVENYEFLMLGGRWHLVATSNTLDEPWLFTLAGDPRTTTGWLSWTGGYQLSVPPQAFNSGTGISSVSFEHANSAFICDASSLPGHFYYLFYAGSPELSRFGGWGHAVIGVARSTDLVHWQVPPG